MKILLTGKVKSGKTTLLAKLLENVSAKQGMIALAVVEDNQRVEFSMQDSAGHTATLARTDRTTGIPVGRFFVDLHSLDIFIDPLFTFTPDQLLYLDEIGHMQLHSQRFQQLVRTYLDAPNDYFGTVSSIYEHPLITEVTSHTDVLLCTVTPENRESLFVALNAALAHRAIFNGLSHDEQQRVLELARHYLTSHAYISLKKLFGNAIVYVAQGRIRQTSSETFVVSGNHDEHQVTTAENSCSCDCDLFTGRGQFAGKAAECSHIQAIRILDKK